MTENEERCLAKIAGLELVLKAHQALLVDALALVALQNPALVQTLLNTRRLMTQQEPMENDPTGEAARLIVRNIETALQMADAFSATDRLGPR